MQETNEKPYTIKSVQRELFRLKQATEKKTKAVQQLQKEIKANKKRSKELQLVYNDLVQDRLQQQIAATWFKDQKLSPEQVNKFLELSKQLSGKIDYLDVDSIVQVVEATCVQAEKVDTCINFSENTEAANEQRIGEEKT